MSDQSAITFYDAIAGEYNDILNSNEGNRYIRKKVADEFQRIVQEGTVLDFGGGTGLDLPWLVQNNYDIIFCEPSMGMRKEAEERSKKLSSTQIRFLEDFETSFRYWNKEQPFKEKVDAILANFAVVNCISDIDQLFKKLAIMLRPGGHLIALVLKRKGLVFYLKCCFQGMLSRQNFRKQSIVYAHYKDHRHRAYVYSLNQLKKAFSDYFYLSKTESFPMHGFLLIHLIRK